MTDVTPRLARRLADDFPEPGSAEALVRRLSDVGRLTCVDHERVQAAVVLWARGDRARFDDSLALCFVDWRDVLVRGGLADDDWRARLDAALGPA